MLGYNRPMGRDTSNSRPADSAFSRADFNRAERRLLRDGQSANARVEPDPIDSYARTS